MPVLDGVRIGPLDPDRGENFGQVGGQSTARLLIRHHVAMHPPALMAALGLTRQELRSLAVDREEADAAVRSFYEDAGEPLPEETKLLGYAVRGADETPERQVLTFTYATKAGRTGKGFMPYRGLRSSVEAGDEAVRIEKLKDAGLPWEAKATAQAETKADRRQLDDIDRLRSELDELRERLAQIEGQENPPTAASAGGGSGVAASPQAPEGGSLSVPGSRGPAPDAGAGDDSDPDAGDEPDGPPEEPWAGYEDAKAQDVRQRLRETRDRELASKVLAYETRSDGGQNRSTVTAAANEVLDHSRE